MALRLLYLTSRNFSLSVLFANISEVTLFSEIAEAQQINTAIDPDVQSKLIQSTTLKIAPPVKKLKILLFCSCAFANGNYGIQIMEMMLDFQMV